MDACIVLKDACRVINDAPIVHLPVGFAGFRQAAWYVFGRCQWCNKSLDIFNNHVTRDHLKPKSKKGKDRVDNLVLSCDRCNNQRANNTANLDKHKIHGPRWKVATDIFQSKTTHVKNLCHVWSRPDKLWKLEHSGTWYDCAQTIIQRKFSGLVYIVPSGWVPRWELRLKTSAIIGFSAHFRDHVARAAYYAWKNAGRPEGDDLRFWHIGEQQMKQHLLLLK